jgi:MFS family permease
MTGPPGRARAQALVEAVTENRERTRDESAHDVEPDPAHEPPRVRRGVIFAIIAVALMMMSINSTIVATALHALQHGLDAPIHWTGWTITAYSLGFVLALPITGRLSEQYGRRRVFMGSVVLFTVASLLCGLAGDIYTLIALRALQAAGGAGFTPSATGLVVDYFGETRDRMVGLFGSIFPVGAMIGPVFGGLFVTYWTWRGIFWVNVPIGLAIIALTLHFIPKDRAGRRRPRKPTDPLGMLLLGVALLAAMLAISYLGEGGARPWSAGFLVPLGVAFVAGWAFLRHVGRVERPFIAPRLIHGASFGSVNLLTIVYGGIPSGMVALIPLYATNRYGIDALGSGTLLVAQAVAAFVFSIGAVLALRRSGYRLPG